MFLRSLGWRFKSFAGTLGGHIDGSPAFWDRVGTDVPGGYRPRGYAERTGRTYWQVYRQRRPAVARLVAALQADTLSDPIAEVIAQATTGRGGGGSVGGGVAPGRGDDRMGR